MKCLSGPRRAACFYRRTTPLQSMFDRPKAEWRDAPQPTAGQSRITAMAAAVMAN